MNLKFIPTSSISRYKAQSMRSLSLFYVLMVENIIMTIREKKMEKPTLYPKFTKAF